MKSSCADFQPEMTRILERPAWLGALQTSFLVLALLGCSGLIPESPDWVSLKAQIRATFPGVRQLSTAELSDWLVADDRLKPRILDARTPEEYEVSHLAGALLAPDIDEAHLQLQKVSSDYPVVVYCSVGYRSSRLAEELQSEGYTRVYNLEGSIFQWANEGRPVFAGGKQVDRVHPYDNQWGRLLKRSLWGFK